MPDMCPGCKGAVCITDKFCSNCAHPLVADTRQLPWVDVGDGSFKNAIGNTLPGGVLQIGDHVGDVVIQNGAFGDERPLNIERAFMKKLKLFGHPVKTSWVLVAAGLGLLADLITVSSSFPNAHLLLFPLSLGLIAASVWFQQRRFLRIGSFSLEADKNQNIYFTMIKATCPRCFARLDFRRVSLDGQWTTILACSRNPAQHQYLFDPTVLEDPE